MILISSNLVTTLHSSSKLDSGLAAPRFERSDLLSLAQPVEQGDQRSQTGGERRQSVPRCFVLMLFCIFYF